MTDKQMIIDGVRVDECCWFDYENDGYKDSCYMFQNECSAQNCYYKQLARKEQECEELKQILTEIKELVYELTNEEYTDFIENKQRQILQIISKCEVEK